LALTPPSSIMVWMPSRSLTFVPADQSPVPRLEAIDMRACSHFSVTSLAAASGVFIRTIVRASNDTGT
jgi:hypothetical protein